uniref:RING-type domain-containing protein n=1 Tax=Caenorhabditis japonica TaxID=281687 RepID=A0A8R1HSK8_CAEJA
MAEIVPPIDQRRTSISTVVSSLHLYGIQFNIDQVTNAIFAHFANSDEFSEEDISQRLIDILPTQRLCDTATELTDNLRLFRDFPASRKFLERSEYDWVLDNAAVVRSLRKNGFLSKQHLLTFMEHWILFAFCHNTVYPVPRMARIMFGHYEIQIAQCYEYISEETFAPIMEHFFQSIEKKKISENKQPLSLSAYTFEEISSQWKSIFGPLWENKHDAYFYRVLKGFIDMYPLKQFSQLHKTAFNTFHLIFNTVQEIFAMAPSAFRPFNIKTDINFPIAIRIFEDNSQRFVMISEVQQAILLFSDSKKEEFRRICGHKNILVGQTSGIIPTVSVNEMTNILNECGVAMNRIELILTPIKRAKHSAVPIITPSGDHCKLAVDVFFETLRICILESKLFQIAAECWGLVTNICAPFPRWFRTDKETCYFLKDVEIQEIRFMYKVMWHNWGRQSKAVMTVKDGGFSLGCLNNELRRLGLVTTFPDIQKHAPLAFDTVMKNKKKEFLRTCDLFDALEHCQLLAFFERTPEFVGFLHRQKSCHRVVGLQCSKCTVSKHSGSGKIVTKSKPQNIEKEKESIKERANVSDEVSNSSSNSLPVSTVSNISNTTKCDTPPLEPLLIEKTLPQNQETVKLVIEDSKVYKEAEANQKTKQESKCCEKCLRTSEKCKLAKEDLKRSENKVKTLEKKLSVAESKLSTLEQRLKKKMQNKFDTEMKMMSEKQKSLEQSLVTSQNDLKTMQMNLEEKLKVDEAKINELREKQRIRIADCNANYMSLKTEMEAKLEDERQKTNRLEYELAELRNQEEQKKKFQEENIQLRDQIEQKENSFQALLDEIKTLKATTATSETVTSSEELDLIDDVQRTLFDLLQTRNQLLRENPMHQARELANELNALTDEEHIKQCANFELNVFNEQIREFMKDLKKHIQSIQANPNISCSELSTLPDFPEFSGTFLKTFEELAKEKLQCILKKDELSDRECLICLQNMNSNSVTIKCNHCKRRYHDECAGQWLNVKSVCPACDFSIIETNGNN